MKNVIVTLWVANAAKGVLITVLQSKPEWHRRLITIYQDMALRQQLTYDRLHGPDDEDEPPAPATFTAPAPRTGTFSAYMVRDDNDRLI